MKHGFAYPLLLIMLFASPTVWAGVYKYVDEEGNVTYSQTPPEKGEYEYKKTPKTTQPSQPAQEKEPRESAKTFRDKIESNAEAQKKADRAEQDVANAEELRKKKCAESQQAVETYTVFRRFKGEDGEVFYMDEDERQQRLNNAKKGVAEFCD